jgi:hypothetical protein
VEVGFSGKFNRKSHYCALDFKDHYENRRYTTEFMVFKKISWWPYIDIFASYGHLINNFVIVWVAINFSVNLYLAFNLVCVCAYYSIAALRLQSRAERNYRLSGLLGQTDLNSAGAISRQHKIGGFYEFLTIRKTIWRIQIIALVVVSSIAYPTTLLVRHRDRLA